MTKYPEYTNMSKAELKAEVDAQNAIVRARDDRFKEAFDRMGVAMQLYNKLVKDGK